MKKKPTTWDPLANVGKAVDNLLSDPRRGSRTPSSRTKGGRPRAEERERIVLYLTPQQVYNLKKAALDKRVDTSTLAREVFQKSGY